MTRLPQRNSNDVQNRKVIEQVVLGILGDLGVAPRRAADKHAALIDLITGDDFSFVFVPCVEDRLQIRLPVNAWGEVYSVQDAIDLLVRNA